jgi:8-oxo-dGTP pyrophosphatase MutT (NUDIX family)
MTAPTISATPKKALDQRATSRHDNAFNRAEGPQAVQRPNARKALSRTADQADSREESRHHLPHYLPETMVTKANQERKVPLKPNKRSSKSAVRIQYGALPYRFTPDAALEILLVTARQTKRWIIPKGWPIKRLRPPKSAAPEAFEEAGVRGKIGMKSVGLLTYDKALDENGIRISCEVKVFPLLVRRQSEVWPEREQRATQWVEPSKAVSLIKEPELKKLVTAFAKRVAAAASKTIRDGQGKTRANPYAAAAISAVAGSVSTHATTMLWAIFQRTAEVRRAAPTPTIAPVIVWVVETGTPNHVARKSVSAPPVSAQNPVLLQTSLLTEFRYD